MQADVFVAFMLERLDMQIVRRIDILADLQDHRFRFGGSEILRNDSGKAVADRRGYAARMLLPLGMSRGRSGFVRPVFGLWYQHLRILLSELIRSVLLLILLKFLSRRLNIFRAVQFIDVLLEFSAVDQSAHVPLLNKRPRYAVGCKNLISP